MKQTRLERTLIETMNKETDQAFGFWTGTQQQKDNLIGRLDGILQIARTYYGTNAKANQFEKLYVRLIFKIAEQETRP